MIRLKQLWQVIIAFLLLSIITGIIYPLVVLFISQKTLPYQANGSLITVDHKVLGSELIGQNFTSYKYFHSRPSATSGYLYNPLASGGSNLSATNPKLLHDVRTRVLSLQKNYSSTEIPVDLVTSSASGVDPDISLASAYFQAFRIAQARNLSKDQVENLINQYAKYPIFGFIGEPVVNVLKLNLALDNIKIH